MSKHTKVTNPYLLNARHLIKQLHQQSMKRFVAMLLWTRYEIDQSGKRPFLVQQFISTFMSLCVGDQERRRSQNGVGFILLKPF